MSERGASATVLVTALVAALTGCGEPPSMDGVTFIVADEFDAYADLEGELPLLSVRPEIALCLAIRAEEAQSDELAALLRAAWDHGVPVIAWMLVAEEDGYWLYEGNVAETREAVETFLGWIEAEGIGLEGVMLDVEMSLEQTRAVEEVETISGLLELLEGNVDPLAYAAAHDEVSGLVEDVQARGYRVSAAAYPFVLDDRADEDTNVQDAFNTPVLGVPFDEVYFMAYRTTFAKWLGTTPGLRIIYDYAVEAEEALGEKGVLALGIIGGIGMVSDAGFDDPAELALDIGAARAGGNERVFIFSLDGMLASDEPEAWLDLYLTPAGEEPEMDDESSFAESIIELLDALL